MASGRATMDFLAAQAAARRRTAILVAWFALAWLGTVGLAYLLLGAVLEMALPGPTRALASSPAFVAGVPAFVTIVMGGGAAWLGVRLARGGGDAVARMVGGVTVDRGTTEPAERRLVNVVEEIAIASGLPVPAIYVLPREPAINGFAAGFTPDRAVVAVTGGALRHLTRDELQGVVAHEFSHLLNGDARLNLRLVALAGGITVLALLGRVVAREFAAGRRSRRGGSARLLLPVVGLSLWAAGSVGAFFGRVIRAAVCRQRELLADAAAVQLTRNPLGLAGALAKIAREGSAVDSAQAPEVSHLFFASGLRSSWLATHPPVEERIRRLVPQGLAPGAGTAPPSAAPPSPAAAPAHEAVAPLTAAALVASAGRPGPAHLAHAARVLVGLPAEVVAAAREPSPASALVLALLADPQPALRALQLRAIAAAGTRAEVERLASSLAPVGRGDRIAVLDLALPSLDALPREAAAPLLAEMEALARADGRTTLFEWAVLRVVERRLDRALGTERRRTAARTFEHVQVDALDLLSALAWAGAADGAGAQAALDSATAALGARGWRVLPRDRISGSRLEAALARLEGATPPLRARILEACAAAVMSDGLVRAAEGEIVRAVAASLGVPLPPLLAAGAARTATGAGERAGAA